MIARRVSKSTPRRGVARRKRYQQYRQIIVGFFVFIVLAGFGYGFANYLSDSPRFQVNAIRVDGANVLREEAIVALAGFTQKDNVLLSDLDSKQRLIEELPYVRYCEIQRAYPDRIIITIEERVPVAALQVHNHIYEIDGEGVVLRELENFSQQVGPLISKVPSLGVVVPGQKIEQPELHRALALWNAIYDAKLTNHVTISEIIAADIDNILVICDDLDYYLQWGRSPFNAQAKRLDILWNKRGVHLPCKEFLDLRFDRDLVCK